MMFPRLEVGLCREPSTTSVFQAVARQLIFLGLLCCTTALAQPNSYRFDHWTTDNGLPQNSIRTIVQTREGYLWMTTFDGLARFDGVRFTVFDKSNTPAITNNRFTTVYEDREGTLWAGADHGEVITYRNGVFTSYVLAGESRGESISVFRYDLNGELMILSDKRAYYLRAGQFIPGPPEYWNPGMKLYRGPSGTQWTIDARGVRQVKNGQEFLHPIKFAWGPGLRGLDIYEDRRGFLWLADQEGVWQLKDGQKIRYTEQDGLPPHTILRPHCEDDDGGIWFSIGGLFRDGTGVVRFKDGRFTVYGENIGLPVTNYHQLIADREGSIWVATIGGLFRLRKELITTYSTVNGLQHNEVYPLLKTRNGDIWVGTTHGPNLFRKGSFAGNPVKGYTEIVQSFLEDRAGRIWIGSFGWLHRYENGRLKNLTPMVGENALVWAIHEDHAGAVWIATQRGIFKISEDKVTAAYKTEDGLPSNDVKVIHESANGDVWFGTYGGLARFKDGKFDMYTAKNGLAGNTVRSIYEDAEGTFWIGTYDDGLSRFRDGKFFNYRTEQGLHNNGVFQILEDRHGYFWISCNKGIYRVSRRELNEVAEGRLSRISSVAFGKNDGMLNTECNGGRQPAGLIADDGKLWFPTMGGIAVVDPEAAQVNPLPPPVTIEAVRLERGLANFSHEVTVAPGQREIEIAYTGLSFLNPEQVKFRYKLEGLDTDWVDVGTRRVAYFPYLSPGSYTFRVIAANSDGIWNTEGAALRIVVQAPFYRTVWFGALVGVSIVGLGYLAYRTRVAQLQRRQEEQALFSRRLIESQESERKRIAAELHDGLGQSLLVIKNRALVGGMSPEDAQQSKEQFDEISLTASQAIDEARRIAYDLRPYHLDRLGLSQSLEAMAERVAASTPIQFTIHVPLLDGVFSKEEEASFYRIVQECVNNILKHSQATEALIAIVREEEFITLTVSDNGKGFLPTGDESGQTQKGGFGLIGMAERVRMLDGAFKLETAPGQGTTITIKFPVR